MDKGGITNMSNAKKIVESLKGGAIAKATAEEILEAIKSDSELSAMKTHLGVAVKDAENIHNGLDPKDQIIAQKFNLYDENGDLKENVIVWAPCTVENFLRLSGVTVDDKGEYENTIDRDHRPSFLGKNIKKAFTGIENADLVLSTFVSSFVTGDYQLGNNVFYQIYISKGNGLTVLKVARDFELSPKKVKKEA